MTMKKRLLLVISMIIVMGLSLVRVNQVCAKSLPSTTYPMATSEQCSALQRNADLEKMALTVIEMPTYDIAEEIDYSIFVNEEDVKTLGNVLYGEARGLGDTEKSAVIWCILNRLDNGHYGKNIYEVVTAKNQFCGYSANRTYKSDSAKALIKECEELSRDVLIRYYKEKDGVENVGRTLPSTYLYFTGDGKHNNFVEKWRSPNYWNWSLESPYED